jgi:hypothetical protein
MGDDKFVDESWKDAVANEKTGCGDGCGCGQKQDCSKSEETCGDDCGDSCGEGCGCGGGNGEIEVNFFTYMTSLGYQAMIFLGEIPNPMSGQTEKNLRQAKFIIDTLVMMKEKTKGNLTDQENSFLEGTLYELQMKFVELMQKGDSGIIS